MKAVFVTTRSDSVGGAQVSVREIARSFLERGHQVTVLVGGEGPFTAELERFKIPYRSLRFLRRDISVIADCQAFFELREVVKTLAPDILSLQSSKAGWLGRCVGSSLGIPVIFTVQGWAFTPGVPRFRRLLYLLAERLVSPLPAWLVTVSEYDRRLALRHGLARPDRAVTIHNTVRDVSVNLRAACGIQPPRLIMVARFEAQKDHSTLLRALARLRDMDWSLELVGAGPLQASCAELARALAIGERVTFPGARADVAERLAQAQIFVLTSLWEGFPLSILEAMRTGLPVVASDTGGVAEAVVEDATGFLVPRGDEAVLSERLRFLIGRPAARVAMGRAGRGRYEKEFGFEAMIDKTLAIHSTAIGGSASGMSNTQEAGETRP